jgi:coproporphyrinogen III oxidase-like Fe-S oxidoreductase
MKERTFETKNEKTIIKSSRGHGYIASHYLKWENGICTYCGCTHLQRNEIDDYIKNVLDDFEEVV